MSRLVPPLLFASLVSGCTCAPLDPCDGVRCVEGWCDPREGRCVSLSPGAEDAGADAAVTDAGLADAGLTADAGLVDVDAGARCVTFRDCPAGEACDGLLGTCARTPPTPAFPNGGGARTPCMPFDGGNLPCVESCPHGFVCLANECVLAGSAGLLQVTLRFPLDEDLDLHVVEPTPSGPVELWFSEPLQFPALGKLDLDSNAGCNVDGVNVENVIYPAGATPHAGTYKVRVEYYQVCAGAPRVPYQVTVRVGREVRHFCGEFDPVTAHHQGTLGSGVPVVDFVVP